VPSGDAFQINLDSFEHRSRMTDNLATNLPAMSPPPEPPAGAPRGRDHRRGRRRGRVVGWVLSTLGVIVVAAVVASFVIHVPYVIISPGSATPLDQSVVAIKGAPTYPHRGNVTFLTVRVSTHDPTLWRVVTAWLDPDRDVEQRNRVVGCLTDTENQRLNTELMDQSQNDAKYVALTRLGYAVQAEPAQIRVIEVCRGAPAYGKLEAGDRVLAVDDHAVTQLSDVGPLVRQHRPGAPIPVTYEREGVTRTATIDAGRVSTDRSRCVPANGSATGTTCLGIASQEFMTYRFPIDVKIDTQRVGGPSAGLAFALAIIDDLTPGDLTGGKRVAVTGEIAPDGSVHEVGGVEQKAITARTNGVALMIVPKKEVKDARRGAGNLRVVGVANVDAALTALRHAGGAPVPPRS
jgi:PDZ domain-containing protein